MPSALNGEEAPSRGAQDPAMELNSCPCGPEVTTNKCKTQGGTEKFWRNGQSLHESVKPRDDTSLD